jgi:ketosteroid isomerase-like protein
MQMGRLFAELVLLIGLTIPGLAADRADLERTFEDILDCVHRKDAEGLAVHFHPEAVLFLRNRYFPLDFEEIGKSGFSDLMKTFLAEVVSADFQPVDVSYRVSDGVGLVWGLSHFSVEPRSGPASNLQSRFSAVFVQSDNAWKLIHWHSSALPSVDARPANP